MNPNKTDSRNRNTEKKSTVGKRTFAVILAGTALTLALAGCGSSAPSAEESAQVSTSEETQQAAAEETTQTADQASASSTEDASPIDYAPLTDGLTDMAEKYSQGAFAGISFQSAVTAAQMLDWYVTNKPSDIVVTEAVKNDISTNGTDTAMLKNGLDIVYSAAEDTLKDTGALETGGWNKGVTWTESDIQSLFGDICKGAGIEMPERN